MAASISSFMGTMRWLPFLVLGPQAVGGCWIHLGGLLPRFPLRVDRLAAKIVEPLLDLLRLEAGGNPVSQFPLDPSYPARGGAVVCFRVVQDFLEQAVTKFAEQDSLLESGQHGGGLIGSQLDGGPNGLLR